MTYTDAEIERAARILCEESRVSNEQLLRGGLSERQACESAEHFYQKALAEVRQHARSLNIESALKQAKDQKCLG